MTSDSFQNAGDPGRTPLPITTEPPECRRPDESGAGRPRPLKNRKKIVRVLCGLLVVWGVVLYFSHHNPIYREVKAWCLGRMGTPAAPTLVGMLPDEDDLQVCGQVIAELYGMKAAAAPALIDALLKEKEDKKRGPLTYAIGIVGAGDKDVGRVLEAMSDSEPGVRSLAVQTLPLVCGHRVAVPALIKALGDSDAAVQMEAVKALALYGPAATAAIPALQSLKRTAGAELRARATEAVKVIQGNRTMDGGD